MRKSICAVLFCVAVVAAGCGSGGGRAPAAEPTVSTATETELVGRWERVNECEQLVGAFEDAGLGKLAPSFVGDFFPDADPKELARKDDLCDGAQPFTHSHFFTKDGAFGSLTEDLEQVDDGRYELASDGRFVISKEFPDVTFNYRIDGDELSLTPVLTDGMRQEALAHPFDFTPAGWAITMSYPGQTWKRVGCADWC